MVTIFNSEKYNQAYSALLSEDIVQASLIMQSTLLGDDVYTPSEAALQTVSSDGQAINDRRSW
jgi:hypothetical protein